MYDITMLNPYLVEQQGLNDEDVDKICALHDQREELFDKMAEMDPETENRKLGQCAKVLTQIEFDLQAAWKFEQLTSHHTWWYQVPHCTCPKLDNAETFGTDRQIYNEGCPIHGRHTWTSDSEPMTWSYLTSLFEPLDFEEFCANPWKAYSKALSGTAQKLRKKFVSW